LKLASRPDMPRPITAPTLPKPDGVEPVIDLLHLRGFTDGDLQLEHELLTLFLSSAEVYLAGLTEALAAGQSWAAIAHALKGASANLGARRVLAHALEAERAPPSAPRLEALRAAIQEVRAFRDGWQD
jgi:HPt (histidine-containing phosphotransfer) domain-containing protein